MTVDMLLPLDPLPALLAWDDPALNWFVQHDLLQETAPPVETLWELPEAVRRVQRQQADGSWRYPGRSFDPRTGTNYNLLETYRQLGVLVEMSGLTRNHPALQQAAAFVFSCQTGEGDIRGILGNQAMPYYHGALLELLIKAGYGDDLRVKQGLNWFRTHQSADGLWETGYGSGPRAEGMRRWVGLAICRMLQRFQALESGR